MFTCQTANAPPPAGSIVRPLAQRVAPLLNVLLASGQEGAERRDGARCGSPHLGVLARHALGRLRGVPAPLGEGRSPLGAPLRPLRGGTAHLAVGRPGAACKTARGSRSRLRLRCASGDALSEARWGHGLEQNVNIVKGPVLIFGQAVRGREVRNSNMKTPPQKIPRRLAETPMAAITGGHRAKIVAS